MRSVEGNKYSGLIIKMAIDIALPVTIGKKANHCCLFVLSKLRIYVNFLIIASLDYPRYRILYVNFPNNSKNV